MQVPWSLWWLKRHERGPVEALSGGPERRVEAGWPSGPRQAPQAAASGDIAAREPRRLILTPKRSARRSSRATCRAGVCSCSGWPSAWASWCRRTACTATATSSPAAASSAALRSA
ncbi:MAG: hypothetical protein ACK5IH_09805 [Betaproteobacteria bacterium]